MRKGLTLIELILSMVIVAIVFTVIPRIIFATNKSTELVIKEDALFNAMSMMGRIIYLPWDENNTQNNAILETNSSNFECNSTTGYRVGGFVGSRNCIDSNLTASATGQDGDDYNDIDDFNGYDVNTTDNGKTMYDLNVSVVYMDDDYENKNPIILNSNISYQTTNIKEINVTVSLPKGSNRHIKQFNSTISYYSLNLGQIYINRRSW